MRVVVQSNHLGPKDVIVVDLVAHVHDDSLGVAVRVHGPRDIHRDTEHHTEDLLELAENTFDRRPFVARNHLAAPVIDRPVDTAHRIHIELVILLPVGPVRVHEQLELDRSPELLVKVCDLRVHCDEAAVRGPGRCHYS